LKLIEQKQIDVKSFITHRYTSLGDVESALANDMNEPGYVKGVVVV
jgi:threonine dehydrogenase-like Zn-dependent dehydrogenase